MEKKKYFVVVEAWENGDIDFDILETEYEEDSEEFFDIIEEKYLHNLNSVFWAKLDADLLVKLKKLMEKINEIVLKTPISEKWW